MLFLSNAILKLKDQLTFVNSYEYFYVKCNFEVTIVEEGRSLMIFTL